MAVKAEILSTHTPELFRAAVQRAASSLRAGEVVALPTETVYGLAANALNDTAVARIFEAKGRPSHNPIIVHVASLEMARDCAAEWPPLAGKLARAFWPGPLTIILPAAANIPRRVTAGGPTVGLRWPSHPLMQAVIQECQFPLAAPSANLSNRISPTSAEHVIRQLGDRIRLIIDGGHAQVGIESTVLDISVKPPRLLRPGMIHEQALLAVVEQLNLGTEEHGDVLRSPGQLPRHYSPETRLVIWSWQNEAELLRECGNAKIKPQRVNIVAHTHIPSERHFRRVSVIPHDPEAFARALYGELHASDGAGADLIVVEALPESGEWRAITDRLRRATSSF